MVNSTTDRSILMLSIGVDLEASNQNDTIQRHRRYARVWDGSIHILTNHPRQISREFGERLTLHGTGSSNPLTYPWKAWNEGSRLVNKHDITLIYTQDPFGTALVGRWIRYEHGCRLLMGNHSEFLDNPHWIRQRPVYFSCLNKLAHWNIPNGDHWRVLNNREKRKYLNTFGLPEERIHVLPTPPNLEPFLNSHNDDSSLSTRRELGIDSDRVLFTWVGRPTPVKRLPLLIKAFTEAYRRNSNIHLLLIGNQRHARENIDQLIHTGPFDDITWLRDGVAYDELPRYYNCSDIYVHPSVYEGFGKTMVEAQASGLPVITTDTGGGESIVVDEETGRIVPREDRSALSSAMVELANSPDLRKTLGQRGQERCRNKYDTKDLTEAITETWSKMILEKG